MCVYTGAPIITATCNRTPAGGEVWNISVNTCEEEHVTETTRDLRTLSLVSALYKQCNPMVHQMPKYEP